MSDQSQDDDDRPRDWRISAVLLAVWLAAMAALAFRDTGIPLSMLAIGTAFFVLLIPAMNDLVSSIDRRFGDSRRRTED